MRLEYQPSLKAGRARTIRIAARKTRGKTRKKREARRRERE